MAEKVVAASDHAGIALRGEAVRAARARGYEVEDLGPDSAESVDYPDFARAVADAVAQGRAALCRSEFEARMARAHNDANVLCLGERVTGPGLGAAIVEAFLSQGFEGGRHARRVEKINALDRR